MIKNNPMVPKFSSCWGLSSTLSRECGSTTLCGCFGVSVGVRGVTICHYLAQTCPWDHLAGRKKKIYCLIKNDREAVTFVNLIFRNFRWNDNVKSFFCIVGTSWIGWGRFEWHWHMGMSYLTSLNTQLFKNIAYVGSFGHYPVQITFTCILLSSFFRS